MITINPVATVAEFEKDAPVDKVETTYTEPVRLAPYMRRHMAPECRVGKKRARDEIDGSEESGVIDLAKVGIRGVERAVSLALAAFDVGRPAPTDLVTVYYGSLLCGPDVANLAARILDDRGVPRPSLAKMIGNWFIDDYGATWVGSDEEWEEGGESEFI
jgi:hypothetical protein